jgi:hypothetical protein
MLSIMQTGARPATTTNRSLDPTFTFFMVLIWPIVAILLVYFLLVILLMAVWLWSVVAPVDLEWLTPALEQAVDDEWWADASTRFAAASAWVMPSFLATTIGLCAAIFALPNPDQSAYSRLARIAIAIASVAALWAWASFPSAFLADDRNPVPAVSALALAAVIALLAALSGSFIRNADARVELLRSQRARLRSTVDWMTGQGWRVHRPDPWWRIALWAFVPAMLVTLVQAGIFVGVDYGIAPIYLLFNLGIGAAVWAVGLVVSWPIVARSLPMRILTQFVRPFCIVVAVVVPVVFAGQIGGWDPFRPRIALLAATYVIWSVAVVLTHTPVAYVGLRKRLGVRLGSAAENNWAGVLDWTLAASVLELRLARGRERLASLDARIEASTPAPSPRPVLVRFWRRLSGSDG